MEVETERERGVEKGRQAPWKLDLGKQAVNWWGAPEMGSCCRLGIPGIREEEGGWCWLIFSSEIFFFFKIDLFHKKQVWGVGNVSGGRETLPQTPRWTRSLTQDSIPRPMRWWPNPKPKVEGLIDGATWAPCPLQFSEIPGDWGDSNSKQANWILTGDGFLIEQSFLY